LQVVKVVKFKEVNRTCQNQIHNSHVHNMRHYFTPICIWKLTPSDIPPQTFISICQNGRFKLTGI